MIDLNSEFPVNPNSQVWQNMLSGRWYLTQAKPLRKARNYAKTLCCALFNQGVLNPDIAQKLLPNAPVSQLGQGFYCDYGINISAGHNFSLGDRVVLLDGGLITFGDNVQVGDGVTVTTVTHHNDPSKRIQGWQQALPVVIGDDVILSQGVVVLPGAVVPAGCTVPEGAVVTSSGIKNGSYQYNDGTSK